ncbi:MAG: TIGR02679 domain-containing protein, partial [Bifidobacteriaceae bacterium]|nr:TIGR02679 domain-containing protein [Bifidobacteriaceae bacterium]
MAGERQLPTGGVGPRGPQGTAATGNLDGLETLLGTADTAWLLGRVRGRLERGDGAGGPPLSGRVVLKAPTHAQSVAIARLLGPPPARGHALSVDLALLERTLRGGLWPAGVADAVVTLTGPVTVRGESAAREARAWAAATDAFAPAVEAHPSLGPWFARWTSGGGHKRIARAQASRLGRSDTSPEELALLAGEVLGAAAQVMVALPVPGELRAVFARRILGDAHGLDRGRPVATVVGAAIQALTRCDDARGAWEAVGIGRSALASTVLCLGIPGVVAGVASGVAPGSRYPGDPSPTAIASATAVALEAARSVPLALVLTAEQVMSGAIAPVDRDGVVFVCENPSILESAAAALRERERGPWERRGVARDTRSAGREGPDDETDPRGREWQAGTDGRQDPGDAGSVGYVAGHVAPAGPPSGARGGRACLVCVSGQPSAAAIDLLARVSAAGAHVCYHGDFDWAGLR